MSIESILGKRVHKRCTWKCSSCWNRGLRGCQFYRSTEGEDLKQRLRDPIVHEFHPHPLERRQYEGYFVCNACYRHFVGDSYSCERCNFDLDVKCASELPGRPEEESGLELHFSHHHLLTSLASDDEVFRTDEDKAPCCQICRQLCSLGDCTTLGCKQCRFYIHASCKEALPREIERPYHECTLFLVTLPLGECVCCRRDVPGLCFYCGLCNKRYCLRCCLLNPADLSKSEGVEEDENARNFRHFFHIHDLTGIEKPIRISPCYVCGRDKLGPVYACLECPEFLMHVSCANYPSVVESYIHFGHPLHLAKPNERRWGSKCNQCCKVCDSEYVCPEERCRGFSLDPECASLVPVISYKRHKHLLSLTECHADIGLRCDACNLKCTSLDCLPVFRCGLCNFTLHLQCGPLPSTVNTKYHVHQLQLVDYFVEENRDDFCCHVCEETRDPLLCVYCCPDCDFVAHLKCLLPEITLLLKGKGGHVNLKTVGRQVPSELVDNNLAAKQIEQYLTEEKDGKIFRRDDMELMYKNLDRNFLKRLFDDRFIFRTVSNEILAIDLEEDTFEYSDEEFKRLIRELESLTVPDTRPTALKYFPRQFREYVEKYSKSVTVLDQYQVPENLIPVFNDLFDKYGDISVHSREDPLLKSVLLCWVCIILEDLRTTKVVHVTESNIKIWWSSLIFLKNFSFDTEFILEHVKRLVRAYFGVRAQHYVDSKANEFQGTIRDRSDEIERLERKMEKAKAEREEARKQLKDHQDFVRSKTTSFIKQSIKEGRRLKWRYAATGLLNVNGRP